MKHSIVYLTLIFTILLGSHRGYVALWRNPAEKPAVVFPTPVSSLPREDQLALEKGIVVRSNRELQKLLEDLLS